MAFFCRELTSSEAVPKTEEQFSAEMPLARFTRS